MKDIEYICGSKLSQNNINILNAVTDAKNAMERNANLGLIMQNFIISVKSSK